MLWNLKELLGREKMHRATYRFGRGFPKVFTHSGLKEGGRRWQDYKIAAGNQRVRSLYVRDLRPAEHWSDGFTTAFYSSPAAYCTLWHIKTCHCILTATLSHFNRFLLRSHDVCRQAFVFASVLFSFLTIRTTMAHPAQRRPGESIDLLTEHSSTTIQHLQAK